MLWTQRRKNGNKPCGLVFHQCFLYFSSPNCLLWIISQNLYKCLRKTRDTSQAADYIWGFCNPSSYFTAVSNHEILSEQSLWILWSHDRFQSHKEKYLVSLHLYFLLDLPPLDLLSFVLERDTSKPVPGVHIKQAGSLRGLHFSSPHTAMSFPASQLLVNCDLFPQEFSIVLTLKVSSSAAKVSISETDFPRIKLGSLIWVKISRVRKMW